MNRGPIGNGDSGPPLYVRVAGFHLDAVGRPHRKRPLRRALERAEPREQIALEPGELVVRELAELEAHLCLEQLLAEGGVVLHLGFRGRGDLVEHETERADEQAVEDEHGPGGYARSSFSRMFTKL